MNTLELKREDNSFVIYIRRENVEAFERFSPRLDDHQILKEIKGRNYFQYDSGSWKIILTEDDRTFEDPKFSMAIDRALSFIEQRDMLHNGYTF